MRITPQIPSGNFAGDFSRNSRKFYGLLYGLVQEISFEISSAFCTGIPAIISYGKLFRIMEIPRRNFLRIPKILVGGIPEGNSADESKELKDSLEGIQQQKHG